MEEERGSTNNISTDFDRKDEDYNHSATKKTAAQTLLDVALLMSNSSQLRTICIVGPQYRFYTFVFATLILSIIFQVITGLLLIYIARLKLDNRSLRSLNKWNDFTTGIILIVITNIFITAFEYERNTFSSSAITVPSALNVTGGN